MRVCQESGVADKPAEAMVGRGVFCANLNLFIAYITHFRHDDVIKWKHFQRYWPFVWGIHRSPVNSPHKCRWRGALMFSLICVWINGWVNNREAGDLRRYRAHYDVTVMGKAGPCNMGIRQLPSTIVTVVRKRPLKWQSDLPASVGCTDIPLGWPHWKFMSFNWWKWLI